MNIFNNFLLKKTIKIKSLARDMYKSLPQPINCVIVPDIFGIDGIFS